MSAHGGAGDNIGIDIKQTKVTKKHTVYKTQCVYKYDDMIYVPI